MKILHIRYKYLAVTFIYYLILALKDYDNYFLVRTIDKNDLKKYPFEKRRIIYQKYNVLFFINYFFMKLIGKSYYILDDNCIFYKRVKKLNPDVIHAHMGKEGVYALTLARKIKKPLVTTFYGADMSSVPKIPYWKTKYQELFKKGNAFVVEGEVMKQKLAALGCDLNKIFVVPITFPLDKIKQYYKTDYSKKDTCRILMVSNFVEKKGYYTALKVFDYLTKKDFSFSVKIIGDGPLRKDIDGYIKQRKQLNIQLLGKKNIINIYKMINDFDVFLHPSEVSSTGDTEGGSPTIILEMQMLGLPIISTFHRDIPNIIPKDNHFLLAQEKDVWGISNNIIKFFSIPEQWQRIVHVGREFVLTNHSPENIRKKMGKVYDYVTKKTV